MVDPEPWSPESRYWRLAADTIAIHGGEESVVTNNNDLTLRFCAACGRPRLPTRPTTTTGAVICCDECHGPLTLDEIRSQFREANVRDNDAARQLRGKIVDDLIAALKSREDPAECPDAAVNALSVR